MHIRCRLPTPMFVSKTAIHGNPFLMVLQVWAGKAWLWSRPKPPRRTIWVIGWWVVFPPLKLGPGPIAVDSGGAKSIIRVGGGRNYKGGCNLMPRKSIGDPACELLQGFPLNRPSLLLNSPPCLKQQATPTIFFLPWSICGKTCAFPARVVSRGQAVTYQLQPAIFSCLTHSLFYLLWYERGLH